MIISVDDKNYNYTMLIQINIATRWIANDIMINMRVWYEHFWQLKLQSTGGRPVSLQLLLLALHYHYLFLRANVVKRESINLAVETIVRLKVERLLPSYELLQNLWSYHQINELSVFALHTKQHLQLITKLNM